MASQNSYDLLVVGGGVNGCGIARDAAGRGLRVMLVEREDLAIATSSASTKLIHGGLRYLEYYEFRLVREALQERERLVALAPHIIWPLRLVVPIDPTMRPAWLIRMGLFLYDHIGGKNSLPKSRLVRLGAKNPMGAPLEDAFQRGFAYSDAWVDDARLVMLNAKDAAARGARVETRAGLASARRTEGGWEAVIQYDGGKTETVTARAVVNAAGPWVQQTLTGALGQNSQAQVRLVKGSHIVIPRLYDGDHAYFFQNPDKRVIFTIPYEGRFTLIGTTDVSVGPDDKRPTISDEEVQYLCAAVSRYFKRKVAPTDVVWTYSGVRPLYDDGADDPSAVTRDYVLDLNDAGAPLLSVYGGKITTYRRLAEHAMEKLAPFFGAMKPAWTGRAILPGGDTGAFDDYFAALARDYAGLPRDWLYPFARRHGSDARALLGAAKTMADLGRHFGGGLTEAEARWCQTHEWAKTPDDVLWRRTKCGLHMTPAERTAFGEWWTQEFGAARPAA